MTRAWQRVGRAVIREIHLPTLRLPGAVVLLALWAGVGTPDLFPSAGGRSVRVSVGTFRLQFAESPRQVAPALTAPTARTAHATFAEVVEAARRAWSRQDAAGIVSNSRELLLQLPGADTRASVSRDQAIRLVQGVLRRSEAVSVRVQTAREVGPGQGYAELVRQYRVTGTDEVQTQRILLAFRLSQPREAWELVELRVLQAGE
ncbi:MAG: hypothetical protein SGI84_00890 [Gemmatimonadota bacterium]|nr:hypothetical protein [Gemmatimonadota bacterium]